jgi:hypothetical protein
MARSRSTLVIALCGLGLMAGVAAQVRDQPSPPVRGTGAILGRVEVVAADQRTPLRRATVVVTRDGGQTSWTLTNAEGHFTFDSLAPGVYRTELRKAGFVMTSAMVDHTIGRDDRVTAVLEVQRAGALEGRFIYDRGVPLERLKVIADLVDESPARNTISSFSAPTDDLGRFRIHTLPPGPYQLRALPPGPWSGETLFYPGTLERGEATILTVASGKTVDRLDVTVPTSPPSAMAVEAAAAVEREIATALDTPEFPGRIAGRVTRSDVGAPIPNVAIQLATINGLTLRTTSSDGDGGFVFAHLPEGRFVVSARASGFISPNAPIAGTGVRGLLVTVTAGSRNPRADIAMAPACAIEVRVVDEFGEPAPDVSLKVFQKTAGTGESTLVAADPAPATTGPTDDRGWFHAYRLPAGDYYVVSVPERLVRSGPSTFASTYYPGTTSADLALPIRVEAGLDAFNASFRLVVARTAAVSGVAVSADGQRLPGLAAVLMPRGDASMFEIQDRRIAALAAPRTTTAPDGSFVFNSVLEGAYTLSAFAPGWFGTMPVTVIAAADSEPVPLVLTVRAPGTARGRIIFDGPEAPPGPRDISLMLRPTDPLPELTFLEAGGLAPSMSVVIGEGAFEIRGVTGPGIIGVFSPPGSPWVFARVMLHGRDITDVPYDFHVGDVSGIEVVLTSRVGTVSGVVKDADAAEPGATVVIFGADGASPHYLTRTTRTARPNEQGAFQITKVLPGRYFAIARPSSAGLGASQLLGLRARATVVTVTEGGNAPVTLAVVK